VAIAPPAIAAPETPLSPVAFPGDVSVGPIEVSSPPAIALAAPKAKALNPKILPILVLTKNPGL
jgi:hypothetical protein